MYRVSFSQAPPAVQEGVVAEWLAQEGRVVDKGQVIARIEAPQVIIELEAPVAGTLLKTCVKAGGMVRASAALCYIGKPGEKVSEKDQVAEADPRQDEPIRQTASESSGVVMSADNQDSHNTAGDVIPVLMPQAGQTMEEGTLLAWKVKEGLDKARYSVSHKLMFVGPVSKHDVRHLKKETFVADLRLFGTTELKLRMALDD